MILSGKFRPIDFLTLRSSPGHVVNPVARPDIFFRVPMTIETPFHVERLGLANQRHLIDAPVAGGAPDALGHVNAVIEIDVVGQIMDPIPLQRHASGETRANRRKHLRICPNLRMTRHARFSGWHSSE